MKLRDDIKNDLKQLDYEYNGGITIEGHRVNTINSPILLLGLGGTGSESLLRAKNAIGQTFKRPTDNIEYLAIDADESIENLRYGATQFDKSKKEFLLLNSANLSSMYKNKDSLFKNTTKGWLSDSLRLQQVKHGAGGIRQAGRFLLFTNINNIVSSLTEKINKLIINRNTDDLLYIFIFTGVAGGTGSGIFVDIPYLVRKIAESKGFTTENVGMIFLPDVNLAANAIDGAAAVNIKANGFAGLKELDYLMNLGKNYEYFEQSYSDIEIKTDQPPYDLCHLISAKNEDGKTVADAKNYCMNVAAETIINFIANEEVIDGQNYTINSYLSNIENNKANFLVTHSQKQPVNYIYNIVGAASAILPTDFLINHISYKIFDELNALYENSPQTDDITRTLQELKIDLISIEHEIELNKPKPRNLEQYDYSVIKRSPEIIEDVLKGEIVRYKEYLERVKDTIVNQLKERLAEPDNIISRHFADLDMGPFYVRKEFSNVSDNSVLKHIDRIKKQELPKKKETTESIEALQLKRQILNDKIRNKIFALSQKKLATDILSNAEQYYKAIMRNETYDTINKIYDEIYKILFNYWDVRIDTCCELLITLKELFGKFKNPNTKQTDSFTWDIINVSELCSSVMESQEIDTKSVLKKFLNEISINYDDWMSNDNITDKINSFLTKELHETVLKSMDYYLELVNGNKVDSYINEKISALQKTANVMFPLNTVPKGLNIEFPPYSYLAIPSNAPKLRAEAKLIAAQTNIKSSKILNRIYMHNLKIAVALYCYSELNEYETVYEASIGRIPGLHLYETVEKNWKLLPSPNYDRLWLESYDNPREREKNQRIRDVFDKAMDFGYIKFDNKNERYIFRYSDETDLLSKFNISESDIENKNILTSSVRLLTADIKSFLYDENRLSNERYIYDLDKEYVKGLFIYMPEINSKIEAEVEQWEKAAKILDILSVAVKKEIRYMDFVPILYMNKIYKSRKSYKYNLNGTEKTLYIIENIQEAYIEYTLFNLFLELPEKDCEILKQTAYEEIEKCSDAEYEKIMLNIDEIINSFKGKCNILERPYLEEAEAEAKLAFYKIMIETLEKEKKVLC